MEVQNNREGSYPKETDGLLSGRSSQRNGRNRGGNDPLSLGDHDLQDRLGFIRKVYAILSVQLFVTFGAIFVTKTN